jgi:uncharacterized protein YndB with AHSA1/START domain
MSDLGTIVDGHTVRFERIFSLPPDRLWEYLTSLDGLSRWLADGHIGPERAELHFPDNDTNIDGEVTTWDPPRLVEFDWIGGPTQLQGSRVRFELTPQGDQTRLVLTHTRVLDEAAPDFAAGWHRHLDTLSAIDNSTDPESARPTWRQLQQRYLHAAAG